MTSPSILAAILSKEAAMRFLVLTAAVVLAVAGAASAEDWPRFRGPTGQGVSRETGLPLDWTETENVAWKTPVPGEGWSSPIVMGDAVFVTAATDDGKSFHLMRIARSDGSVVWNTEVLRQETRNRSGQNSYATSTPVTDGQHVYVVAADGQMAAVTMDGRVAWVNRDFPYYSQHGMAASPALCGDLVIVPFDPSSEGDDKRVGWQIPWDQSFVLALEKATGKVRWKASRGMSRIGHCTPIVLSEGGKDLLISPAGDVVQAFDPVEGRRLWTAANKGEAVVPSPVVGGGMVFQTSGFGAPAVRAVRMGGSGDVTATHIAWEQATRVPMISSMIYADSYLYAVTEKGSAVCMKAATGEIVWDERLRGAFSASPVWAEGRLYVLSEKGETFVLQAGPEFKVLATNPLGEKSCASPAVSGGQLFIRTAGHVVAVGRPVAAAGGNPAP
jgi:outer membrane protein assembly factor BamB